MFVFALWDMTARRLTLVRDRLGIKPLYWGQVGDLVLFGSQPKAILAHPAWNRELDRDALDSYFRFGYVPAPRAIYAGMRQLEPGSLVEIDSAGRVAERRYWDLADIAAEGVGRRHGRPEAELTDQQIGRASCRERVCQYGSISVGAGSYKKKNIRERH